MAEDKKNGRAVANGHHNGSVGSTEREERRALWLKTLLKENDKRAFGVLETIKHSPDVYRRVGAMK